MFLFIFRFDYDRKLLETAIQNDIQMKEIMKTFNSALQEIKGKYCKFRNFREGFIFAKVLRTLTPCELAESFLSASIDVNIFCTSLSSRRYPQNFYKSGKI